MKLNEGYITHITGGEHVLLTVGAAFEKFRGVAVSNETAAFIVEQLKVETTREEIIDAMLAKYNVDRERVTAGVDKILTQLREIGAID